ncbi:MAG: rRNA maturation RNase YbeY [Candidatus Delongbacteria bacterium]
MQHDQQVTESDASCSFPQPELEDPDGRSPRLLEIEITHPSIRANRRVLRRIVLHALREESLRHRELTLALVDPAEMQRLNREFHGADEPTDHLGFQYEAPPGEVSGDIFVCPAVCAEQSAQWEETPRRELARVVLHGVLHLAGWRDDTPAQRRRMHVREDELLAGLLALREPAAWLEGAAHVR